MNWDEYVAAWSCPPVDEDGYQSAEELLDLPPSELRAVIEKMRAQRYGGWRNAGGRWRDLMGLDELYGFDVLDYGCGVGLEALELARVGNRVSVADISTMNLELAVTVAAWHGARLQAAYRIGERWPFLDVPDGSFDVFYCCGVLHHCRDPWAVLRRAWHLLRPGGQARVLVYGPELWREVIHDDPPEHPELHPEFQTYVRHADTVGDYADWYDEARLTTRAAGLFTIERSGYLGRNRFLAAILRRVDHPEWAAP